ncbi:MAG TPA: hypothetical protein DIT10_21335 [Chryseobacterium sp.]|uniref:hypothetical protein n=1 Tax=Chryseobacterium lactis TaxID=1241981 RepID=UPI000ED774B1|nr:hypothetical protein [Chryseobacterium lactis]HCN51593.1 hypothetical protein [Chryseobacterium sp.]
MITIEQEKEIGQYLSTKKLNSDLFFEIKDHFLQQISALMDEKQSNFQEAFLQTKISWSRELEMVRADALTFRKVTRIEKQTIQRRFRNITLYSIAFSLLFTGIVFIDPDLFVYFQLSLFGITLVLLGYNFIFRKMRLYSYLQLSFHPLILKNALMAMVLFTGLYFLYDSVAVVEGTQWTKFFSLYAMAAQIQLLYFNARKTNVLI